MEMNNIIQIRSSFPALNRKVYGKNLVYLDNAATSQRLDTVIDMWNKISLESNSNIHRAVHRLAQEATIAYEDGREAVRSFINASSSEEVVLTSGTTASINMLAYCFGEAYIHEGDEVIVSEAEHHSNIVPWQLMCKRKGAYLKVVPVDDKGCLSLEKFYNMCGPKTKIIAIAHISNVLGIINPIEEIVRFAHSKNIPVLIDGAQGIVHQRVDVQKLDCDFYAFSGHKIYASTGTGVLYAKKKFLNQMPPYMGGGEMVGTVTFEETSYAELPLKYEAGTPNFAGGATLKPAMDFMLDLDSEKVRENNRAITEYIVSELESDSRIHLYGRPDDLKNKIPLFSLSVDGVHHEDLALILDKMGIAVRSGHMCAEPLMTRFGLTGMLRASFAPYNTLDEASFFIKCLRRAIDMLA